MDPRSQRVGETGHTAPCQNVTGSLCMCQPYEFWVNEEILRRHSVSLAANAALQLGWLLQSS